REPEPSGDLRQHLRGGLAETAFDLTQVRVRDAGTLGELPDGHLGRLTLCADERPDVLRLGRALRLICVSGHLARGLVAPGQRPLTRFDGRPGGGFGLGPAIALRCQLIHPLRSSSDAVGITLATRANYSKR